MEPVSTLNLGNSPAHGLMQNQAVKLKSLTDQTNRVMRNQSDSGRFEINEDKLALDDKSKELKEVAQKFEALLIHQLFKAMRKTVHKSDLMNSFSLQQYESMLDEEMATTMAKKRGIGLADMLFYQLSRLEETANPTRKNLPIENGMGVSTNE